MITVNLILLAVSAGLFFLLKNKSIKARLGWALLFFLLSSGALAVYILIIGDRPPDDAITINEDAMKREGMTREEWKSYIESQKTKKQ